MPSVGGGQGGVDSDGGDVRVVVDGEGLWWLGKLYNIWYEGEIIPLWSVISVKIFQNKRWQAGAELCQAQSSLS